MNPCSRRKAYAAIPAGSLVKIMPRADGGRSNLPIRVGCDPDEIPVDDGLVTQIMPLKHADVAQVSTIVTALVSTGGQVTAFTETNTIIVTDTSSAIHRAARIVRELDVEGPQDNIEVVPLKYASAGKICEQVTQILQRGQAQSRLRRPTTPAPQEASNPMKILPDERTNSVILVAGPSEAEMARRIIARLDIERPLEAENVHVIYLEHAQAKEIEKAISAAVGKITVPAGPETIAASPDHLG